MRRSVLKLGDEFVAKAVLAFHFSSRRACARKRPYADHLFNNSRPHQLNWDKGEDEPLVVSIGTSAAERAGPAGTDPRPTLPSEFGPHARWF